MAGIVTQKREHLHRLERTSVRQSDGQVSSESYNVRCIQETTSYRSGPRYPSVPTDSFDRELRRQAQIYVPVWELKSNGDTGHEFSTIKQSVQYASTLTGIRVWNSTGVEYLVRGQPGPWKATLVAPEWIPATKSNEISSYGARAINATAPTRPEASLTTMLGETLRDGLPSLPVISDLLKGRRPNLGSEYLNLEFGWKPLVNDLVEVLTSVANSANILRQFRRDSGRIVRRKFHFPTEISFSTKPDVTGYGAMNLANVGSAGLVHTDIRQERRIWFSGAYTYYLDVGDSLIEKAEYYESMANHLLGLEITPEVLWELTPWSWLVDWFANVGTILGNVQALSSDGLVIRWGYLMCHTKVQKTLTCDYTLPYGSAGRMSTPRIVHGKTVLLTERKERFRATPFGFGLALSGFTDRQWAILAALGMTRAPRIAF